MMERCYNKYGLKKLGDWLVNSRKVVFIFWSTLLIGSISGGTVGILLNLDEYVGGGAANFFVGLIWMLGISAAFTLVSQMGFFAYLFVHRFGLGLSRSHALWNRIQWILIVFVFFDLVYFRYIAFGREDSIWSYFIIPTALFLYALLIAWIKAKETNKGAFVPALFFMFVITTIEWIPALVVNNTNWLYLYLTPILIGNTYQLLLLHRLHKKD